MSYEWFERTLPCRLRIKPHIGSYTLSGILRKQVGGLHQRSVQLRLQRPPCIISQPKLIHVAYNANDRERDPCALARVGVVIKDSDVLTDGVLTRKIFLRETAVNDGNLFRALIVRICDKAPSQQRNTHSLQVFWFDDVFQSARVVRLARGLRLALRPEADLVIALHGMRPPMQRRVLDSGDTQDRGVYRTKLSANGIRRLICQRGTRFDAKGEHIVRIESGVEPPEVRQRTNH